MPDRHRVSEGGFPLAIKFSLLRRISSIVHDGEVRDDELVEGREAPEQGVDRIRIESCSFSALCYHYDLGHVFTADRRLVRGVVDGSKWAER